MVRMEKEPIRRSRFGKILRTTLITLIAVPLLYLLAAAIGAFVPRNPGWQEPLHGVVVYISTNGVHADLVMPAEACGFDLYELVDPAHVPNPDAARGWISFGWGQREFYLETPRWRDLTVQNAARSVFGGDALMHVEHLAQPLASSDMRPLRLNRHACRRLVAAVADGFDTQRGGRPSPLLGRGYGSNDVFYEATGRYNAFRTSNQWTADALADAGVLIGAWTPFVQGIMWRFRQSES